MKAALRAGVVVVVVGLCCVASGALAADKNTSTNEVLSDLQVRVLKLEEMVQQLTGQVEEERFKNEQMAKQLQQLQDDLSLRVAALEQASGGHPLPAGAPPAAAPPPAMPAPAPHASAAPVYDPNAPLSQPVAVQPKDEPLTPPPPESSAAAEPTTAAAPPLNENGGFVIRTDAAGKALPPDPNAPKAPPPARTASAAPQPTPKAAPKVGSVAPGGVADAVATDVTLPKGTPKQQYDYAIAFMRQQDWSRAEAALREFLKVNPSDPLAANAQYWLGESLYARGDYQQAAVEFMNGYRNYRTSAKGPDNLLKLGLSLEKMQQVPGACTAFGSIAREYPAADDKVRKDAQAERSKLKCTS
jgi:tol-pal system protein YbgF